MSNVEMIVKTPRVVVDVVKKGWCGPARRNPKLVGALYHDAGVKAALITACFCTQCMRLNTATSDSPKNSVILWNNW